MKKVKIALWVIVAAFIALVFFQNQDIFLAKQGINLNLSFAGKYSSELSFIVWLLIALLVGLLVSYFYGLTERFKLKKTIKGMKAQIDDQAEMMTKMRSELESRTGVSHEETPVAPEESVNTTPEPNDVQVSSND